MAAHVGRRKSLVVPGIVAVAVLAACGSRTMARDGANGDAAVDDAAADPPSECGAATEAPDADCTIVDFVPMDPSRWPQRVDGPTACPAKSPHLAGVAPAEVLRVRGAGWSQFFSDRAILALGSTEAWCGADGHETTVYFTNAGSGTHTVVDQRCTAADGSPIQSSTCLEPHEAIASHDGWGGEGLLVIEADEGTSLRGSVDIVFADHCRLLADFVAPLCQIE